MGAPISLATGREITPPPVVETGFQPGAWVQWSTIPNCWHDGIIVGLWLRCPDYYMIRYRWLGLPRFVTLPSECIRLAMPAGAA